MNIKEITNKVYVATMPNGTQAETMTTEHDEYDMTPEYLMQLKQDRPEVYEFLSEAMKLSGEDIGILAAELKRRLENRQKEKTKAFMKDQAEQGERIIEMDPDSSLTLSELSILYDMTAEDTDTADGLFNVIDMVFHMGVNAGYQIANNERGVQ